MLGSLSFPRTPALCRIALWYVTCVVQVLQWRMKVGEMEAEVPTYTVHPSLTGGQGTAPKPSGVDDRELGVGGACGRHGSPCGRHGSPCLPRAIACALFAQVRHASKMEAMRCHVEVPALCDMGGRCGSMSQGAPLPSPSCQGLLQLPCISPAECSMRTSTGHGQPTLLALLVSSSVMSCAGAGRETQERVDVEGSDAREGDRGVESPL